MPRVSVIIPSYNHEKYVAEAIQSVLDQSYQDFEIVIVDDGSTDNTVGVIRKFNDSRIRLYPLHKNRGFGEAARTCIDNSNAEFISMLSSDDAFLPDKLEKQVEFLDQHSNVQAVFGYAQIIDEDGNEFKDTDHYYSSVFNQPNRSRFEWLKFFFYNGNCLCHPSAMLRRQLYEELGYYDERYAQLPDFDMWIRTCLKHDIHIIPEELIKFRVRAGEANASGVRPVVKVRAYFEFTRIFRHYLEISTPEELLKVFPEAEKYGRVEKEMIPYFIARLALDNDSFAPVHQHLGLNILFELLGDGKTAQQLEKKYGFTYGDFISLTGKLDIFNVEAARLRVELENKEKQIEAFMNSMSWKVTAPLRSALNIIKK